MPEQIEYKLPHRRAHLSPHAPGRDIRLEIILAANRRTGQAAQNRQLAHVRECVGDGSLEQLLSRSLQRLVRRQVRVKSFQCRVETRYPRIPGERWRFVVL